MSRMSFTALSVLCAAVCVAGQERYRPGPHFSYWDTKTLRTAADMELANVAGDTEYASLLHRFFGETDGQRYVKPPVFFNHIVIDTKTCRSLPVEVADAPKYCRVYYKTTLPDDDRRYIPAAILPTLPVYVTDRKTCRSAADMGFDGDAMYCGKYTLFHSK
eukprot:TRINITY_DN7335_c0_g1_i1.p3 TRINITY_DN7335_c0_g1~~TRINITY_DN7335_c0_g1_i1.p3  ORF type:complete len:161 (+),score=50.61 TRINITY_DN7335_c0_g1_i1:60-542(+)